MLMWGVTLCVGLVVAAFGGFLLIVLEQSTFPYVVLGLGAAITQVGLLAAAIWMGTQHLRR